ncbi:YciI family protein [Sphaerisporangium fuscum]|uniref:YciI family protein n=1 Tax=Sphaerisporangium fuscum TaxID=2835868 RepID=UPI001BDBD830|nr:YciI family protein [Sphaerisporangium fuscum]
MKYMLLIHNRPGYVEELPESEAAELLGRVDELMKELTESGELIRGEALAGPSETKTVRVRDGVPVVTDGPFVEAKEHFAGYLLVECDSTERAVEIAASWPDARYFAMEVRPVTHQSGPGM